MTIDGTSVDAAVRPWARMFAAAAAFNFLIGLPVWFASGWTFAISFRDAASPAGLRHWGDFGFAVALIGIGYAMVACDPRRNRGIVWLGVIAKLFDVVVLTVRTIEGVANPIVLVPGAIDGGFVLLFIAFLRTGIGRGGTDGGAR